MSTLFKRKSADIESALIRRPRFYPLSLPSNNAFPALAGGEEGDVTTRATCHKGCSEGGSWEINQGLNKTRINSFVEEKHKYIASTKIVRFYFYFLLIEL